MAEPAQIRKGTTVNWTRLEPEYADGSWTGKYTLFGTNLPVVELGTTASGEEFTVDVKPAITRDYFPGVYSYAFAVTKGADTHVTGTGVIEIIPFASSDNKLTDAKAFLKVAQDEYNLRITGKANSYSIKDRSLSRASMEDIRRAISYWQAQVNELQKTLSGGNRSITYARFT